MTAPVIHWFRRDLRLSDNLALHAAAQFGAPIIPVYIFDPAVLEGRYFGAPRLAWLLKALFALERDLRGHGGRMVYRYGDPREVLAYLVRETGAQAVTFNRDYTPFAAQRDDEIARTLAPTPVHGYDDTLLVRPGDLLKADGTPFTVYTPFKKHWLTLPKPAPVEAPPGDRFIRAGEVERLNTEAPYLKGITANKPPTPSNFGHTVTVDLPEAGESAAQKRLNRFLGGPVYHYKTSRDFLPSDPDDDTRGGWSFLSPYFRFGLISPRQAYWAAREAYTHAGTDDGRESVEHWVSELVWREFYAHILWHFPHALRQDFRPQYAGVPWRSAPDEFHAWVEGRTGYPVVDAAMRQMQHMGWMPNRARMIVASFLCKDLLIHWSAGEMAFMQGLIDGDPAQNNGGWQWTAGTGTDAQPYFRVFNPVSQGQKFDPDGVYVRRWVPELREVPTAFIHAPWQMDTPPADYPPPIVDHAFARDRALAAFAAKDGNGGE